MTLAMCAYASLLIVKISKPFHLERLFCICFIQAHVVQYGASLRNAIYLV